MLCFSGKFVVYKTRIPPIDVAGRHKTPSVRINLKREYSSSFIQKGVLDHLNLEEEDMEIIETGKNKNALIVSVKGRMDVLSAPEFEKKIGEWIEEGEINFVIDFSGLVFISSAGLRSLLITAKKLEAKKGWIALTSPKDVVKKIFEISGFHSLIPTYESVEAALEQI